MANGTIAFDTLTTSDSVNTGTEKSIDTSYLLNGVAKSHGVVNQSGTVAITDSFNTSSVNDDGTGLNTVTFTNNMANSTYTAIAGGQLSATNETGSRDWSIKADGKATSTLASRLATGAGTAYDTGVLNYTVDGDLA